MRIWNIDIKYPVPVQPDVCTWHNIGEYQFVSVWNFWPQWFRHHIVCADACYSLLHRMCVCSFARNCDAVCCACEACRSLIDDINSMCAPCSLFSVASIGDGTSKRRQLSHDGYEHISWAITMQFRSLRGRLGRSWAFFGRPTEFDSRHALSQKRAITLIGRILKIDAWTTWEKKKRWFVVVFSSSMLNEDHSIVVYSNASDVEM